MQLASTAPVGASDAELERELKFVLPEARSAAALAFLRALSRPDPKYFSTIVSTIYYDTPGLELLGEKLDSDYLKRKVRLRWYAVREGVGGSAASFLELKSRVGSLRTKARVETPLQAAWLDRTSLEASELLDVLGLLRPLGGPLPTPLLPAVLVRYSRYRFVEPVSGTRVSLDTDIEASRSRRGLFHGGASTKVPGAVLEVKGAVTDLPRALRPLAHLDAKRGPFSKYAAAARQVLGTVH
ncbi:MAG: VTC domain-containing protein [Vicinamibacterales bacterium]